MKYSEVIEKKINSCKTNQLIFSSRFYVDEFSDNIPETAYYKTLERLCRNGTIAKLSKGIYYRPEKSRFGDCPLSQKDIINSLISDNRGVIVGYTLYNSLSLTTQISKNVEIYSSDIDQSTKSIGNINLKKYSLEYNYETCEMIAMLEILKHFYEIQDINYHKFFEYCCRFCKTYDENIFEKVNDKITYPKRTISFLKNILGYFDVSNTLKRYVSELSIYKHPRMEEIYELART